MDSMLWCTSVAAVFLIKKTSNTALRNKVVCEVNNIRLCSSEQHVTASELHFHICEN